jgi:hypothetical protein
MTTDMDQMHHEHSAWRQVCLHLAKLGIDINTQEPLACAVRLWGEELVALRASDPRHTERALFERRADYVPHVIRLMPPDPSAGQAGMWEVSYPTADGSFTASDSMSHAMALKLVQERFGADSEGRVCLLNKVSDDSK